MCRRPRRIIIIIVAKGGEEGLKKGVVVVRVTKSRLPFDDHHHPVVNDVNDDFDERGFGTTGIGNMHHLKYNGQQHQQQRRFDDVFL